MGEPAVPTPAERAATLELARAIVEAVRNDTEWPAPFDIGLFRREVDTAVFRLAQDLVDAHDGVLLPREITRALHEGAIERRVAEGDNAWTTLRKDRERYRAVYEAARRVAEHWRQRSHVHDDLTVFRVKGAGSVSPATMALDELVAAVEAAEGRGDG